MWQETLSLLQAAYEDLCKELEALDEAAWWLPTDFFGWTPWDEIAHLCQCPTLPADASLCISGPIRASAEAKRHIGLEACCYRDESLPAVGPALDSRP